MGKIDGQLIEERALTGTNSVSIVTKFDVREKKHNSLNLEL